MFQPDDDGWGVLDPVTGISVKKIPAKDYEILVRVALPDQRSVMIYVDVEPMPITNASSNVEEKTYGYRVFVSTLNDLAKFRNGTRPENSDFIRYILPGLSLLMQRVCPLRSGRGYFFTDRSEYEAKGMSDRILFDVPEEEIGRF